MPIGVWLGHRGRGEWLAVAVGNAGRALPELVLIAVMAAFLGLGTLNLVIALLIIGIPPILINSFVGVRQVDRDAVEAARGMGMSELGVITRVELPLAVPTIMGGVRTAAIAIVATATIAPLAGRVDARRLHHQRQRLRRRRRPRRGAARRPAGARPSSCCSPACSGC